MSNTKLVFLGTGAALGTPGQGKSKRQESSLYLAGPVPILIDVTRDFTQQAKLIKNLSAVLLTHGHSDAIGGFAQLNKWLQNHQAERLLVYVHSFVLEHLKKHFPHLPNFSFHPIRSEESFNLGPFRITSLEVPHSQDPKFPTFAWKIENQQTLVYASDIAQLTDQFKNFCHNINYLIIDGATWKRKIFSHLEISQSLPNLCSWPVEKIILTQIGKSVPSYPQLKKLAAQLCPKAIPAYDSFTLAF